LPPFVFLPLAISPEVYYRFLIMPAVAHITQVWRLLDSGPSSGAENMRIDERLLREASDGEIVPTLRFYTWDPPAVSLGRFQEERTAVNAEACKRLGVGIVRRTTGGRAVLHHRELTYSIVSRTDNPLFPKSVLGAYKVIATGLQACLLNLGIQADIVSRPSRHAVSSPRHPKDPACFSSPSWYEIVADNRKIVGSAQRRLPGAFLQHGSILIDHDPVFEAELIPGGSRGRAAGIAHVLGRSVSPEEVVKAFTNGFSDALGIRFLL